MLLLYRNKYRHKQSPRNIYIPLCFYFIFLPSTQKGLQHPFTFHYASTLSDQTAILNVKKQNLHSTMLLLYLFRSSSSSSVDNDLHSTMLLLYPAQNDLLPDRRIHLHSTMLLLYPVPLFPFYFLQYGDTFCLPPFCIALLSKIFLLPLYKI